MKKNFDCKQFEEIVSGLDEDLSFNEIKIYANPDFDHFYMEEIKKLIKLNISLEYIKILIEKRFSWHVLFEIYSLIIYINNLNFLKKKQELFFQTIFKFLIEQIEKKPLTQKSSFFIQLIEDIKKHILMCEKENLNFYQTYCYLNFIFDIIRKETIDKYNTYQLKEIRTIIKTLGCKVLIYINYNMSSQTIRALRKILVKNYHTI
jgi:hypothetical protein